MPFSLVNLQAIQGLALERQTRVSKGPAAERREEAQLPDDERSTGDFLRSLPCVVYECTPTFEVTALSDNVVDLIGIPAKAIMGSSLLTPDRIPPEDLSFVLDTVRDLKESAAAAVIHRLVDARGLPVWVSHSLQKVTSRNSESLRGWLIGLGNRLTVRELDRSVVSRFVHKLGNHFQLLNLVISSLRRDLLDSRETEVLQETVCRAIELSRTFSEYNQTPDRFAPVNPLEILQNVVTCKTSLCHEKKIIFRDYLDSSLQEVAVTGDPLLLEIAVGHVVQNAIEASVEGREVTLDARGETIGHGAHLVKISIVDSGCGIAEKNLERAVAPFLTTKNGHDGLGLSIACRFVEMHGGLLEIRSVEGRGTEVTIRLPAARQ